MPAVAVLYGAIDCTGTFCGGHHGSRRTSLPPTLRAKETLGTAGKPQGRQALLFSSMGLDEFGKGKPLQLLDIVLQHATVLKQCVSNTIAAGWWAS